jgi:hypothetical protein
MNAISVKVRHKLADNVYVQREEGNSGEKIMDF